MAQHLRMPLVVAPSKSLATVEQGTPPEIAQSVALLLATRPGDRRSVPGYGTPDPLFVNRPPVAATARAVETWEPRAAPTVVATTTSVVDTVTYPGIAADSKRQGFYLADGTFIAADPGRAGFFVADSHAAVLDQAHPGFFRSVDRTRVTVGRGVTADATAPGADTGDTNGGDQ